MTSLRALALTLWFVAIATVAAQSDRVTVRMAPAPHQVVYWHMTIATIFETADGQRAETTNAMDVRAEVGPADAGGSYDARIVISNVSTTMSEGQGIPAQAQKGDLPTLTFHYDRVGRTTSVSVESGRAMDSAIIRAMNEVLASVAPITLAVGDTVVVPRELTVPLSGFTWALTGEARYTLMAIDLGGGERVAHLRVTSAIKPTSDQAPVSDGEMDVNLDRGTVLHHQMRTELSGQSSRLPVMKVIVTADLVK